MDEISGAAGSAQDAIVGKDAPPPGTLGKTKLWALAVGQVIGAGVISLVGISVGMTGYSSWLSYALAIVLGFFVIIPYLFASSTFRLSGGNYSIIAALSGERLAGMYIVTQLFFFFSLSLFGVSIGSYVNSLWPAVSPKLFGILFMTFFFVVNLFGVDIMAGTQRLMSAILVASLLLFVAIGLTKIKNPIFNFSDPNFMPHGISGLVAAVYLLVYSTTGYSLTINYGKDAKNARRDIPWALVMTVPVIMFVYVGVAMVATGVLPLATVAGKPLTMVAKAILPAPLFILFMVGGPIMALTTTINSSYASSWIPQVAATNDGWYPAWFAKKNKRGAPYIILIIQYLFSIVPVLLGLSMATITNNIMLVVYVVTYLFMIAVWQIPKKFPEAWKRSRFHCAKPVFYTLMVVSLVAETSILFFALKSLSLPVAIISIAALALCMLYADLRYRKGCVKMQANAWID